MTLPAKLSRIQDAHALIAQFGERPEVRLVGIDSSLLEGRRESEAALRRLAGHADPSVVQSAAILADRLDRVNESLVDSSYTQVDGIELRRVPVASVGLYVPRGNLSSIVTWLSPARAAGVTDLRVYLPIDKLSGRPQPEALAVAYRYGARVFTGSARFGFPVLALGPDADDNGVNLLAGPAGLALTALKGACAAVSSCRIDLQAGPSDLAVIVLEERWISAAVVDALAQLEHGPDSHAVLLTVDDATEAALRRAAADVGNRCEVRRVPSWQAACAWLDRHGPETVEVLGPESLAYEIACTIQFAGVIYINQSSSLGDYMMIGRGCGDPTGGAARGHSGISPATFQRVFPIVQAGAVSAEIRTAAERLAQWEDLPRHLEAIRFSSTSGKTESRP